MLPDGQQFTGTGGKILSISPNGTQVVYSANNRLYLKAMSDLQAAPIQGTEATNPGALNPVFSPDGQSIVFGVFGSVADGTLKRISVSGGAPVTICPIQSIFGISWGPDDKIVFGQGLKGIQRVSANGGQPETIVTVKDDEMAQSPQILPGGGSVLFTLAKANVTPGLRWDQAKIVVQSLTSGQPKVLINGGSDARYLPTGHIVYALRGQLFAVPFDVKRLEVTGGPSPVVEGVRNAGGFTGSSQFSFSDSGTLVYIVGRAATVPQSQLAFVDRNGAAKPFALPVGGYGDLRVSPNGKELAFSVNDGNEQNVWVYELSGASSMRRLTFGGTLNHHPIWSPDGEHILYRTNRETDIAEFWQRADGTGAPERLTKPEPGTSHGADSFLPGTGKFIFIVLKAGSDVWLYSLDDKKAIPLIQDPGNQSNAFPSPDGRWIAYQSDESGRFEIYVQPFPPVEANSRSRGTEDSMRCGRPTAKSCSMRMPAI